MEGKANEKLNAMTRGATKDGNLAREIRPVRLFRITGIHGLVESANGTTTPFLWTKPNGRLPPWIRFIWNPQTGTAVLGTRPDCLHHHDLIPPSRRFPFGAWVRGIYLPQHEWVGIRPFFWPYKPTHTWNASHARLNARIGKAVARLVAQQLPKAKIELDITNTRLQELTVLLGW